MMNHEKMMDLIVEEMRKITTTGLKTTNIDTAYKIVDMYKDLKEAEVADAKKEYYEMQTGGGYSGRTRDSRGRYTSEYDGGYQGGGYQRTGRYQMAAYDDVYDRYLDAKREYQKSNGDGRCKQKMMDTLDEYMNKYIDQIDAMARDADCREERDAIKKYAERLRNI